MSEAPNAEVVDEPTEETVDPYADLPLEDGVGFHDTEATVMDTGEPDIETEEEPNVEEPEEDEEDTDD